MWLNAHKVNGGLISRVIRANNQHQHSQQEKEMTLADGIILQIVTHSHFMDLKQEWNERQKLRVHGLGSCT